MIGATGQTTGITTYSNKTLYVSGETLFVDSLHIMPDAANGGKILFGNGENAHIQEDEDTILSIYGANGIVLSDETNSSIEIFDGLIKAPNGFFQESDERYKTFHEEIEIDFDKLKSLPKKYFTWNYVNDNGDMHVGTSAQAVQELYPDLVRKDKDGKLTVDYAKLSVIALKAIDILNEKNKALENKIKEMDVLMEKIKERLGIE